MTRLLISGLALLLAAAVVRGADKEPPLKAKLVAAKTTYTLDLDGKTGEDYRKMLTEAEKKGGRLPAAPQVELTLELTNTSAKDVEFYLSGDPVVLTLELKGPGAVSVKPPGAFTTDFRLGKPTTLAAGKSQTIKISALQYGFRGASESAYWTEPGDYTLSAALVTATKPPPEGVKPDGAGFGKVTIAAEPVKIKVEAKK
jgi:hypothetical protein